MTGLPPQGEIDPALLKNVHRWDKMEQFLWRVVFNETDHISYSFVDNVDYIIFNTSQIYLKKIQEALNDTSTETENRIDEYLYTITDRVYHLYYGQLLSLLNKNNFNYDGVLISQRRLFLGLIIDKKFYDLANPICDNPLPESLIKQILACVAEIAQEEFKKAAARFIAQHTGADRLEGVKK